jgi:hypothetical protein
MISLPPERVKNYLQYFTPDPFSSDSTRDVNGSPKSRPALSAPKTHIIIESLQVIRQKYFLIKGSIPGELLAQNFKFEFRQKVVR